MSAVLGIACTPDSPVEAQSAAQRTSAQQARLAERFQCLVNARQLAQGGKLPEAIASAEQAQAIEREVYGAAHADMEETLRLLIELHEALGNIDAALACHQQVLTLHEMLHGPTHWRANEARCDLAWQRRYFALNAADRRELDRVLALVRPGNELAWQRQLERALAIEQEIVETYQRLIGKDDPRYATYLNNLGSTFRGLGDLDRAEGICAAAHAILVAQLGPDHPDATPLSLARLAMARGDYVKALEGLKETARIVRDAYGESDQRYAQAISLQGTVHVELGDYASAEPLMRRYLDIEQATGTDATTRFARGLFDLADLYHRMGDFAQAKPLYQQAASIYKDVRGETYERYLDVLERLGELYLQSGELARADETLSEGLRIVERLNGPAAPGCVRFLYKLARERKWQGDNAAAGALLARTQQIMADSGDAVRLSSAAVLIDLAELAGDQQQEKRAQELYDQAISDTVRIRGENHPDVAPCLDCLAEHLVRRGREVEAEPLLHRALRILRRQMDRTALVQSERQQLAMSRQYRAGLDHYVALAAAQPQFVETAYREVYRWKGAVFCRRRLARRSSDEPDVNAKWDELTKVANELAALSLNPPGPDHFDAWNSRLRKLTEQQDQLEIDLGRAGVGVALHDQEDADPLLALRTTLPDNVVLVDLLETAGEHSSAGGRLIAFVVRGDQPTTLVDLGAAFQIAQAVERWRDAIVTEELDESTAQREIARLVWQPLAQYTSGASYVLISPDGATSRLPWSALPGEAPESYLIERLGLAIVPVPQLLPELLASTAEDASKQRLLAVGDIDFDAGCAAAQEGVPSSQLAANWRSPLRAGAVGKLPPLTASGPEIKAVMKAWAPGAPSPFDLRRAGATEAEFRKLARHSRWIHLATHGFFAPPALVSALSPREMPLEIYNQDFVGAPSVIGWDPNLLSGVALAGANALPGPQGDDGILTAAEVAALDLSGCELVTLSACETGLGATAGGEGVLGLQRAFQIAGARSTVTSLWKVHDDATRALMTEFYTNLWQRKLGKLEALRRAQLKMIDDYVIATGKLRAPGERVQVDPKIREAERESGGPAGLAPRYWAAFVLAGDWR
ncbi:MAG: CHAT domain-containing protein [Pirellulales bacterium]|nr:CHAT domain-containing protein [Pirellulales bacterium]